MSLSLPYPAQPRRSKTILSPDGQTAKFLYTIIKQLDLKTVDWNEVALQLGITNGHAARMRYSRFKNQIEGIVKEPKSKARSANRKDGHSMGKISLKRSRYDDDRKVKPEQFIAGFDYGVDGSKITKKIKFESDQTRPDAGSALKMETGPSLSESLDVGVKKEPKIELISQFQPRIHHPVVTPFTMPSQDDPVSKGSTTSAQKLATAKQSPIHSQLVRVPQKIVSMSDIQKGLSSNPAHSQHRAPVNQERVLDPFAQQPFTNYVYPAPTHGYQTFPVSMVQPSYFLPSHTYQQSRQFQNQYQNLPDVNRNQHSYGPRTETSRQNASQIPHSSSAGHELTAANSHLWSKHGDAAPGAMNMFETTIPEHSLSTIAPNDSLDLDLARSIMETDFGQWTVDEDMHLPTITDTVAITPGASIPTNVTGAILPANTASTIIPNTNTANNEAHLRPSHKSDQQVTFTNPQYNPGMSQAAQGVTNKASFQTQSGSGDQSKMQDVTSLDMKTIPSSTIEESVEDARHVAPNVPTEKCIQASATTSDYHDAPDLLPVSVATPQPSGQTNDRQSQIRNKVTSTTKSANYTDTRHPASYEVPSTMSTESRIQPPPTHIPVYTLDNDGISAPLHDDMLHNAICSGMGMWERNQSQSNHHQPGQIQALPQHRHEGDPMKAANLPMENCSVTVKESITINPADCTADASTDNHIQNPDPVDVKTEPGVQTF